MNAASHAKSAPARYWAIGLLRLARAAAALLVVFFLALPWMCLSRSALRTALAQSGWQILLSGFGIRLRLYGHPEGPDALIVSNHVSWIDIAALSRVLDCGFVAKSEVRRWPIIGKLARSQGCLFIERARRGAVQETLIGMREFVADRGLVLFPEGTSGEGDCVLPFRSSLFAAAGDRFGWVQPVTLHYCRADGQPLSQAERARVSWVGDAALLPHALGLIAAGGVTLDLWFDAPLQAANRRELAEASRQTITARLENLSMMARLRPPH